MSKPLDTWDHAQIGQALDDMVGAEVNFEVKVPECEHCEGPDFDESTIYVLTARDAGAALIYELDLRGYQIVKVPPPPRRRPRSEAGT